VISRPLCSKSHFCNIVAKLTQNEHLFNKIKEKNFPQILFFDWNKKEMDHHECTLVEVGGMHFFSQTDICTMWCHHSHCDVRPRAESSIRVVYSVKLAMWYSKYILFMFSASPID
jgi:thioredoxin-related protein